MVLFLFSAVKRRISTFSSPNAEYKQFCL